jgi:hypothetical protein
MIDPAFQAVLDTMTLPVAAMIAVGFLWRAYTNAINEHIKDLRGHIATFNLRLGLIEDRLNMPQFDGGSFAQGENRFPTKKELKPIGEHGL